jgi:hypothetical protein
MRNSEITLAIVDISGKRFDKGNLGTLENAHHQAVAKYGITGNQISDDEITPGLYYAHIMEFRDGEHYNDIYLT